MVIFFSGTLMAFLLCLNIGPGLIMQIKASIRDGFVAGASIVVGLYLTNLIILLFSYFGLFNIINFEDYENIIGVVGSVLLMIFGVIIVVRKAKVPVLELND